jgi:hypothetical protein
MKTLGVLQRDCSFPLGIRRVGTRSDSCKLITKFREKSRNMVLESSTRDLQCITSTMESSTATIESRRKLHSWDVITFQLLTYLTFLMRSGN